MEIIEKGKRVPEEAAIDTRLLYEALKKLNVGDFISYHQLSEIIGRDIQSSARGCLVSARRIVQREDRMVFGVIRNEGLKRLNDAGIVTTGNLSINKIHRESRKAIKRIVCIDNYNDLPNEYKIKHNMFLSIFGVFNYATKPAIVGKLESKVENVGKLPLSKTLEAFKEQLNGSKN